jgi:hypothetical protein
MSATSGCVLRQLFQRGDHDRFFSEWGQVFDDEVLATAILDR